MLEDRSLLSTFTVANLLDSGAGSLRAAIASANANPGADTIAFAGALHGTISLTSGELPVSDSVTINGPGANKLSVSGNNASRIFDISGSASVRIVGLTITEGLATSGGGILLEGSAALSISNCTLTGNEALGSLTGSVTVPDGDGGGIEDNSSGALTVTNSTFDTNKAIARGPNNPPPLAPGVIFALGGAIDVSFFSTGPATISNSTFTGNQALGGSPGASAGGGALSNSSLFPGPGATMTVMGCTLSGNAAIGAAGGDGVTNFGSGQGGGINNFASLTVRNSTLTGNLALGTPLAPDVVPSQTLLSGSSVAGGGIFALSINLLATMSVADSTLAGNQAVGGAGAPGSAGSVGEGGGISIIAVSSAVVEGCTLRDNVAQGGAGGSNAVGAPGVSGGIDIVFSPIVAPSVTVSNTILIHNQAIGGAGGSGSKGGDGVGGGINVGTGDIFGFGPDPSSLTLTGCTLNDNQAVGGAGGSGSNGGNGLGGGLSVLTGSSASISTSTINANQAQGGAAGTGGTVGQGVGGGVYNLGTFTFDVFTVIKGNHASTSNDDIFP